MQINQSMSTVQSAEAPSTSEAPAETGDSGNATPPASTESNGSAVASGAEERRPPERDHEMEIAKRFEAVSKKEARNRKFEAEYQTKMADISEKQKQLDEMIAKYQEALSDPIKHYLDTGGDPVQAARRFSQPETEEQREIRAIKEALKKRDETEAQQKKEWEEQTAKMEETRKMREFVGSIAPDEHPYLTSMYEAHEVPALVERLLKSEQVVETEDDYGRPQKQKMTLLERFQMENGRGPSDAEIRYCLEYEAELRAKRIVEAHDKKLRASQAAQEQVSEQNVGPSGISNQHAASTTSGKSKPQSLEEKRKQARKDLAAALEAEAAERKRA